MKEVLLTRAGSCHLVLLEGFLAAALQRRAGGSMGQRGQLSGQGTKCYRKVRFTSGVGNTSGTLEKYKEPSFIEPAGTEEWITPNSEP